MKHLLSLVILAAAWTAGAQGTSEAILGYNQTQASSSILNGTAGWTFQVTNNVTVMELGCLNFYTANPSATDQVKVGLWTSGGTLLASSFIAPTNHAVNSSLYGVITPVVLSPGQTYHIGLYYLGGSYLVDTVSPAPDSYVTSASVITSLAAAYTSGAFALPLQVTNSAGAAVLGPNFLFDSGVPEPSSGVLLGLGALLWAARRRCRQG